MTRIMTRIMTSMTRMKNGFHLASVILIALAGLHCSNEITKSGSPVELIVTNSQNLSQIDLAGDPAGTSNRRCEENIGTINMQVLSKNGDLGQLSNVRVTRYRVSYQRTDGGHLVPAPFVRSVDTLVNAGGTGSITNFLVLEADAFSQAPFAALFPNNGGRDPDTGRPVVKLDVIVELYGQTLGGDNVYDATRFPLDFCYNCGGCD